MRNLFLLSLLLCICFVTRSQTPSQYIAKGDKEMETGFPNSAIFYYRLALSLDTHIAEAHFKAGEAYRSMRHYKKAKEHYRAALKNDERGFAEALFFLGLMEKQTGNYRDAKGAFEEFQEIYRKRDLYYQWAKHEENSTQWAIEHEKDTARFRIEHLDSTLNTVHSEMSPFPLGDSILYFSSLRTENAEVKKGDAAFVEILKAQKDSAGWQTSYPEMPLPKGMHAANGVFSPDSMRFYFSRCPSMLACEIMVTRKVAGSWTEPMALPEPVNDGKSNNTQPMVAPGEKFDFLLFASDRASGRGGMDLWYVEMDKEGEVRPRIRNLGSRINTRGEELSPWFDIGDTTFYFASNWHDGFGGFDIHASKGFPGNLESVRNLGTGINTPADDYYFTYHAPDSTGYFASNRKGGANNGDETCCNDIYKAIKLKEPKIAQPKGTLPKQDTLEVEELPETVAELQSYLPLTLYFANDHPDPRSNRETTKYTYAETFSAFLEMKPGYFDALEETSFSGQEKDSLESEILWFFGQDVETGMRRLERVAEVLLKELQDSASISLAVKGYASTLAASDYNYKLTQRRIASLVNYFETFRGGALKPFIENGQLSIERIPYGEAEAAQNISTGENKVFHSIYNPATARERRIEILRIGKR